MYRKTRRWLLLSARRCIALALVCSLWACVNNAVRPPADAESDQPDAAIIVDTPTLDLLFVIDNSNGNTGCHAMEAEDCPWESGCYLYPPSRYVDFFRNLKPAGQFLFAAIAGPWEPGDEVGVEPDPEGNPSLSVPPNCSPNMFAAPGIRLRAVADALGEDGIYAADLNAAACSGDYSPILDAIALAPDLNQALV